MGGIRSDRMNHFPRQSIHSRLPSLSHLKTSHSVVCFILCDAEEGRPRDHPRARAGRSASVMSAKPTCEDMCWFNFLTLGAYWGLSLEKNWSGWDVTRAQVSGREKEQVPQFNGPSICTLCTPLRPFPKSTKAPCPPPQPFAYTRFRDRQNR